MIPDTPVLYPISNPDGDGEYLVDWSDVTGATSYQLEEADTVIYEGPDSEYRASGQGEGIWHYRVRARSAGGYSPWSQIESVAVLAEAPVLFPISNPDGDGEYLVDWSDVTGATSYQLEEAQDLEFTSSTVIYDGAGGEFLVSGRTTGLWYYRVRASDAGGYSPWSNVESVGVIPDAPVLFPISNPDRNGRYVVDWSEVTGATGYELQEDDNPVFSSPTVIYDGANNEYRVTGQGDGLWYYRVRASSPAGDGPWSNVESAAVGSDAPALASVSNPDGDGEYLLDWSEVSGATSYELQEDDNPDFTSPTVRYSGADSRYQVYGQGTGLWYYRVRASHAGGESPWSNTEWVDALASVATRLTCACRWC